VVGLGHKLPSRILAANVRKCAENNDWRVDLASSGTQIVGGGTPYAVVAFGVEHNEMGSVKICQLDSLFGPLRFERRRAVPLEERAQDFARLGRFIYDQYAWRTVQAIVSAERGGEI
jgi:hypothetical protein